MSGKDILITLPKGPIRNTFFPAAVLNRLKEMAGYSFTWNDTEDQFSEDELKMKIAGKDACIVNWGTRKIGKSILESAPNLKFIGVLGGSVKPYVEEDFFDCDDRVIVNSADVMAKSVAEAVIAYILAAVRDIPYYDWGMKHGMLWRDDDFHNSGLFYKTIGLIGLGQVGRYVIRYLEPFDVKFLVYDPYVKNISGVADNIRFTELKELISSSDIISIHAAQTKETYHMLGRDMLKEIRDSSVLINTARGSIIDEFALIDELKTGRFKAVLDVFEKEPLPSGSVLRSLKNVILIPHMAGPTIDMRRYMTLSVIDRMVQYFNGVLPEGIVTKEKYRIMT